MKTLLAPWRESWVTASTTQGSMVTPAASGCLFCDLFDDHDRDEERLVVYRGVEAIVLLNRYPYNGGHLMVAPRSHQAVLPAVPATQQRELMTLSARCVAGLTDLYHPDGFNLGINQGRAAGAGIPDHLHLHVVPRWDGDTNFMTTVGETRVVSLDLGRVRRELANYFAGPDLERR